MTTLLDDLWSIAQAEMDSWAKDGAFPYDKELLNLLMQTNNMKAMSRETGIPYRSIIYSNKKPNHEDTNRLPQMAAAHPKAVRQLPATRPNV